MSVSLPDHAVSPVSAGRRRDRSFDLLRIGAMRAFVRWPGFPRALQASLVVVFCALVALSWGVFAPPGANAKLFAKTHAVTLLIWGIWWPVMVWVAVWFGRAWCAICPLELVSRWGEKIAEHLRWPRRPLGRWGASGVVAVGLYGAIQLLVAGAEIHRVPAYTAYFLSGLMVCALGTALLFRDRAFCRGVCPVGFLLGIYGRGGMIAVRPAQGAQRALTPPPNARKCPSLLNPSRLQTNAQCLVCCRCVQASADGAMRVEIRPPFSASDLRTPLASRSATYFVMLLSGFVAWELCTEWPAAERVLMLLPTLAADGLAWPAAAGWFKGLWVLVLVPWLAWSLLAWVARWSGQAGPLLETWRRLALPMAVVISAGHLSKGLAKFVSWAPFVPDAFQGRLGSDERVVSLLSGAVRPPVPLLPMSLVAGFSLLLLAAGLAYGVREYALAQRVGAVRRRETLPLAIVALVFAAIIAGWALK